VEQSRRLENRMVESNFDCLLQHAGVLQVKLATFLNDHASTLDRSFDVSPDSITEMGLNVDAHGGCEPYLAVLGRRHANERASGCRP
jgi:hypothetical protein